MEHRGTEPRGADKAETGPQPEATSAPRGPPSPPHQADPAPFRPADPAAPELVTQFLLCQAGLRDIFPVHLPLGSVLTFPEGRVVEGAGSAPGSDPPGPVVNPLRPEPTHWTPASHAFPRAAVSWGPAQSAAFPGAKCPSCPQVPTPTPTRGSSQALGSGRGEGRGT